ncbi:FAD/NAD(P)-binding domain-containing protein [Roridomyces roridus]|uniref:FAD/NAD(P)-binding domain-containing protein n=1 Tax=Roridomyces roridus TaxID=1738132 RepID=A0AAD7FMR9_9AGAR|nr:FAD/NAD(P)-binding domain-containing protein [Roridomyces roridus]
MSFSLMNPIVAVWRVCYIFVQHLIILLYKPPPPTHPEEPRNPYGRVAVIGAGLTGVSSAAHCIAHNFEVVLFEAGPREELGGIWARVNKTSGLQINSHLYRFHPGVLWRNAFPQRDEIVGEITRVWKEYQLEPRTRFDTPVTSVRRVESVSGTSHWLVNDGKEGPFDAIICNVGTCGKPKWLELEGMPNRDANSDGDVFTKTMIHSSELDSESVSEETIKGKKVVVIGSGASGVEAVEAALERGAGEVVMIARTDKWIIPRNIFFDTFLACQPFGREMPLSFIWESFLKHWQYHGVEDLVPEDRGLFQDTPVVNSNFLPHVRSGACTYVRGDPIRLTSSGVRVNVRERGTKPESPGEEETIEADVVVFATGYEKPSIGFLEEDKLFPEGYERPDLYLQNFSTEDWSVLLTNSAYMSAIGTVGHFHIGIYTRILLTLLLDPDARPSSKDMKLWVDVVRFIKRGAKGGALGFFTYAELTIWLVTFHLLRPDRLKWLFFIMCGWGVHAPAPKTTGKSKNKKVGRYLKNKDKVDAAPVEGVKKEEVR